MPRPVSPQPSSLWLPSQSLPDQALTSATLEEREEHDVITLYVQGERAVEFNVPPGVGPKFLSECGLMRQP